MEQSATGDSHVVARLVAGIGLLVGDGAPDLVGDVLDQRPAEGHVQQLLSAADAQHRGIAFERRLADGHLEIRPLVLGLDRGVTRGGAEKGWVDIEITAGDDEAVD